MRTINFPLIFHFHQPVDNFDHVIEEIYNKCYRPLLDRIMASRVKFTLHFTGSMLDWLDSNHPEYLADIKGLCIKGQVELISGGYYEPILAILPDRDKLGQINLLNDKIQKEFSTTPKGFWLAERVWEPQLPKFLNKCGLKYIVVDDNHLKSCGFGEDDALHYYSTEDEGKTVFVFPINESIRYLAPWQPVWKLRDYLEGIRSEAGDRIALFMSDAEKMGEWGTTHELCYQKGHEGEAPYIDELFGFIENTDWVNSVTLSECLEAFRPSGMVYLPTASYDKMEEWVLPTGTRVKMETIREKFERNELDSLKELELERFVKGGFWRYFLAKYPESNNMHKKMLRVYSKLADYEARYGTCDDLERARLELYKGQANDCYWHGQFGGIYLNFLRFSVYKHLIEAEKIIESLHAKNGSPNTPKCLKDSFFCNGFDQLVIESSTFNLYIDPDDGGSIFELDYKPLSYNLLNTLTRWKEAYHVGATSEKLVFDASRKTAFRTQLVRKDIDLLTFQRNDHEKIGCFSTGLYNVDSMETRENQVKISLGRSESIDEKTIRVEKTIQMDEGSNEIRFTCELTQYPPDLLQENALLVDFPIFFNGDPVKFSINSGVATGNPLDGLVMASERITLHDESYGLKMELIFQETVTVVSYSHETFSRMNTDDYQSKYQAIGLAIKALGSKVSFILKLTSP
ncbi:MAG: alpha-amylase/4-alpha-glucanotransferase domain-containing protein [Promethearchaeota archaeon]